MPKPLVSVVMRSHNDAEYVARTLNSLTAQHFPQGYELLSVDDHSTDGTAEILPRYSQVKRIAPPPGPYYPGRTLNAAVRECAGDIVVFNNADAIPQGEDYLCALVKPLLQGAAVAVYGHQLARPDAQWLVKKDTDRAFGDGKIAAAWQWFFSLASSAILKKELLAHPFDETLHYSEDIAWAHDARLRGSAIAYAADALAEHSHNYTFAELRKRFFNEGRAAALIFGGRISFWTALRQCLAECLRDCRFCLPHPSAWGELLFRALPRRIIQKFAARAGQNREQGTGDRGQPKAIAKVP